jgi:hypothetical protein
MISGVSALGTFCTASGAWLANGFSDAAHGGRAMQAFDHRPLVSLTNHQAHGFTQESRCGKLLGINYRALPAGLYELIFFLLWTPLFIGPMYLYVHGVTWLLRLIQIQLGDTFGKWATVAVFGVAFLSLAIIAYRRHTPNKNPKRDHGFPRTSVNNSGTNGALSQ